MRVCWSVVFLAVACGTPHAEFAGNEIALAGDPDAADPPLPGPQKPKPVPWCLEGDSSCKVDEGGSGSAKAAPLDPTQRYTVALSPNDPIKGPPLAPVTLVVFSDFQCPYCKKLALTLSELSFKYPSEVRLVWKDLPLPGHAHALPAALLGRAAYAKGGSRSFWQVHDALFAQQSEFGDQTLARIAERFGLDWPPSKQHQPHLDETYRQVQALDVRSTPTTFVNGRPVVGVKPLSVFVELIESELQGVNGSEHGDIPRSEHGDKPSDTNAGSAGNPAE